MRVATELGYPINRHRSRMERERTRVLGLVLTDIGNPFYTDVSAGTIDAARNGDMRFFSHTPRRVLSSSLPSWTR